MEKPKRVEQCYVCDSQNVHWECGCGSGECYCEDCAGENDYICKEWGEVLIPIVD